MSSRGGQRRGVGFCSDIAALLVTAGAAAKEAPLPTLTKTDMADEATTMKMHSKVRWGNTDEVEGLLKIKGTADCQVRSERATRALVLNRVTHKRRGIAQPTVEPIPALTVVRPPVPRCAHRIKPRATTRST